MRTLAVLGARIVGPSGVIENADLVARGGRISAAGPGAARGVEADERLDGSGLTIWPGLIDLHVHGARGALIGRSSPSAIPTLSAALSSHGVTRFCPTLPPLEPGRLRAEIDMLSRIDAASLPGARPLGIHLEGPYLNPARSGALPPDSLRDPDRAEFEEILSTFGKGVRIVTIAPELPGALDLIRAGSDAGAVMAAGHTEASFAEMERAVSAGLSHVTHCFNAMRQVSHRNPGPVEAALTLDELTIDLICDGRHLHKSLFDMALRCKTAASTALVSDSTAFQAREGAIDFLERKLEIRSGVVRDPQTGSLGGSSISVWDALLNVKAWKELDLPTLAILGSSTPARIAGAANELGSLEPGKLADFFLTDPDMGIVGVYVEGERVEGGSRGVGNG